MKDKTDVYTQPSSMEPLLPQAAHPHLSELTCQVLKASGRLTGQVHSPKVLEQIAALVREMYCYYSNLIEGHKTVPREIERALKKAGGNKAEAARILGIKPGSLYYKMKIYQIES